jgi:hypothetical protein
VQQQPVVLMNPFPHGINLTQASVNVDGGSQGPPSLTSKPLTLNVYMLKGEAHISTRAHDYRMPSNVEKGKESENPYVPLHIERTMGETKTQILKWEFNKALYNPKARAT